MTNTTNNTATNICSEVELLSDNGVDCIGAATYWTIPDGAAFTIEDVENAVAQLNLPKSTVPKPRTTQTAYYRAVRDWKRLGIDGVELRAVHDNVSEAVHTFVTFEGDENAKQLEVEQPGWVRIDKKAQTWGYAPELDRDTLLTRFQAIFSNACDFMDSSDLRRIIQRVFPTMKAFPMRASGGIYFVPVNRLPLLEKMQQLVKILHPRAEVFALPLPNVASSQAGLREAYSDHATGELSRFRARLERWLEKDTNRQGRAWETKRRELQTMRDEALIFEGLLGGQMQAVRDALDVLGKELDSAERTGELVDLSAPAPSKDEDVQKLLESLKSDAPAPATVETARVEKVQEEPVSVPQDDDDDLDRLLENLRDD